MAPKLYMKDASPPVRSVLLTAKALGVDLELMQVNVREQEHLKPEYLKINPQHTVPTLDDNGKIIWDSHAINIYLVTKYGKDDSLFPKDPYRQAIVNQRLHFDSGVLFPAGLQAFMPLIREGANSVAPEKVAALVEAYDFLEKFLEGHLWVAGDNVTIADFNLIATLTSFSLLAPVDASKFLNITAWVKRAEAWPYYDANKAGLENLKAIITMALRG